MMKRLFLLLLLIAFGVSPLLAQEELTQSAQLTENGLTLTISYPASWVELNRSDGVLLATSQSALDALNTTGVVSAPGDMGIIVYMPSLLQNLQLEATAGAELVVTNYLKVGKVEGEITTRDDFQVPAATALIPLPANPDVNGLLGALQFPDGTIIFGAVPGDEQVETITAILKSITLVSEAVATPETSFEIVLGDTPTTFDVPRRMGNPLQLAINLPEDWANHYSESGGLLYLGSTKDVVEKITSTNAGLGAGEVGVTIVMPQELQGVGIAIADTPEHVIQGFETAFKATGTIQSDDTFGVPAAYARVTGGSLPAGGGVVYALAFDAGTILAVIQPSSAANDSLVNLLRSIRLGESAEAEPTAVVTTAPIPVATTAPKVKAIRQWASSADGSSQYGKDAWSFGQATGAPDTETCGDNGTAWAGESSTSREILQVFFDQPVIPSQINIYQTYNPGAIVQIDVGNSDNPDRVLPLDNSADAPGNTDCPGVFAYDVSGVDMPIDFVVIYVDQSLTGNWDEIDAVELVGTPAG